MQRTGLFVFILILAFMFSECSADNDLNIRVFETSEGGNKLSKLKDFEISGSNVVKIKIDSEKQYQEILGFGGSFTESTAYLVNRLGKENKKKVMDAYFGESGANYSLTRTHMNSCDFSLSNYSYAEVEDDRELKNFTIERDLDDIIPMIKSAKEISKDGFRIISSPWTAPPWMKDNKDWVGGKLLPEYYDTWALFFSKYLDAYKKEEIDIWGFTVENEPHGNGNNWESMHFTPREMTDFVQNYLGPRLESDGYGEKIILGYDQNREGIKEWVDVMFENEESSKYFDGTAIHWYESTYEVFPEALQYAHKKAPNKFLIQTEACVDAEVPHWKDDDWYWKKEATDWGWDWAPEHQKHLHPKYVPVYRYARDIIGCLNNWVQGWVDWNMVLDKQGGPNWFKNWCVAPVIVDLETNEVYYTPIYYTLSHFSKFIRPGAVRIGLETTSEELLMTAAKNPDNSIAVIVFNPTEETKDLNISLGKKSSKFSINKKAIQTILINKT